jgi:putative aminopeptidase FrvX
MPDLLPFLKKLISLPGMSGYEGPVRQVITEAWEPLVDEIHVSKLGSLHALRCGSSPGTRPSLLLAAHMDAIGLMVSGIENGFLRVTSIGGLDPRVLPGQSVIVHGTFSERIDLPGVIVQPPAHLIPETYSSSVVPIEYLLIDIALEPGEVSNLVRVGDVVSYAQEPMELSSEVLAGHTLDDRAAVAAVTACLQALQGRQTVWDLWAVATVQEEVGVKGAMTSGYELRPSLAIAIDVTFASGPGSPDHLTYPLGKGPTLGWGPNVHPALFEAVKKVADRLEIPYKLEPLPTHSGTDAFGLQIAAEGIPTLVVSIPLRYMHTPVEVVSMKDIERTGRLLAEFTASLEPDFMNKLSWED